MKFGIRECCDVVFRAKAPMKVGNKIFYKNEPVIYFDTLKTSTLEGAATTVYAQGGRGNARLMSWDGERTVTFTMEDALISPEGLAILTGAGLIEATSEAPIYVHTTEKHEVKTEEVNINTETGTITITSLTLEGTPAVDEEGKLKGDVYVMLLDGDDNMISEPLSSACIGTMGKIMVEGKVLKTVAPTSEIPGLKGLKSIEGFKVLVDYYVKHEKGAMEISITPDKFGGAFYIEGSTLFREYPSQLDLPAEIIIPNGRVQSNFTFTMAGSGDPSTFTFTVDAFPDYTRFDPTEKVLSRIQVVGSTGLAELTRESTMSTHKLENGIIVDDDTDSSPAWPET